MNSKNPLKPQFVHLDETISTNQYIRNLSMEKDLPEGSVVWTDFQTAGRGQAGNSWESDSTKNLTFSIIIYPYFLVANRQFLISQIAALSVKDLLSQYTDEISIKWPNDIYWRDKKICGMLIENDLSGTRLFSSIIGIGINLNQEAFHSDAPNPVSLLQITGCTYDREKFLREFMKFFYAHYLQLIKGHEAIIKEAYFQSLFRGEGFHEYEKEGELFEARIIEIEPTGHLVLEENNGQKRRFAFKEVKFVM